MTEEEEEDVYYGSPATPQELRPVVVNNPFALSSSSVGKRRRDRWVPPLTLSALPGTVGGHGGLGPTQMMGLPLPRQRPASYLLSPWKRTTVMEGKGKEEEDGDEGEEVVGGDGSPSYGRGALGGKGKMKVKG
ncbi:hypothetical protein VTJ04DRAFT_6115 [Mycothermus thermophilus]|uniref:uncharacterized protein n=1 Tax=Humicola insolens TaxID=85995 RepID=UPI0037437B8B